MVGQNLRAARNGAAIPARFANYRRALSRDHRFIHAGDALDNFAVSRNQITGLAVHHVARAKLRCGHHFEFVIRQKLPRHRVGLGLAQRVRLSLPPGLGHRFGEIRKQQP